MGRGELKYKKHFTSSGSKGGGLLVSATKLFDVEWKQRTSQFCGGSCPPSASSPERTVFLRPFHPEAAATLMTGAVTLGEQLRWEPQSPRQKHCLALKARRHLDPSLSLCHLRESVTFKKLSSVSPLNYLRHVLPSQNGGYATFTVPMWVWL